jgi:hypothetical protein
MRSGIVQQSTLIFWTVSHDTRRQRVIIVLDLFDHSFNVGSAERRSEAENGNRMQTVRRPDDVGNDD